MEQEEIVAFVWEALCRAPRALSVPDLGEEIGFEDPEILSALGKLRRFDLVEVSSVRPEPSYLPRLSLSPFEWGRALESGLPLALMERYASLSVDDRTEALRMAVDGRMDALLRDHEEQELVKHRQKVDGILASRVASSELARLGQDIDRALQVDGLNAGTRAILEVFRKQYQDALDRLRRSMDLRR